jgi:phospholipase C
MSNTNYQYFISQDNNSDNYLVWLIDLESPSLLKKIDVDSLNTIPKGCHIVQVGNYILQWSPLNTDNQYTYRLLQFNPDAANPLGSYVPDASDESHFSWSNAAVQAGTWDKRKFFSSRKDFSNPDGGKKGFESGTEVILVSMHNFVLNWIPTEGRGTYQLFNFDPGSKDPLPAAYTPQGAWLTIETGHELLHINGYVLDWQPATGDYVIWQFDAQAEDPLSYPAISSGNWKNLGINNEHRLCVIGNYVLDWEPANNNYRLWEFDQGSENGLTGPAKQGTLPGQITNITSLTAIETLIPKDIKLSEKPGTIDFMRDKIEHVIYYMIENRSFDHICGWLYSKNEPFNVIGPAGPYRGVDENFKNTYGGKEYAITQYNDGKLSGDINLDLDQQDPYHDNSDVLRQMFSTNINEYLNNKRPIPDMSGFALNNGTAEVMQGYSPEQIPVLNGLARNFAISDDWFCSIPSGTTVNRAFALSGSSLGKPNNFQNGAEYAEWSQYPHRASIWKVLWANGIRDFKIYNAVEWIECQYTYNLFLKGQIPSIDDPFVIGNYAPQLNQFFDDLKYGTLPKFSFLEPKWVASAGSTSYHPGNDLIPGERELNDIFTALQDSPLWEKTLLVITFDEHGGLPDHVPPPYAARPWANDSLGGFTCDIMGPRVPTILVSPLITEKTVFRSDTGTAYDSTSILSTLLDWSGIPRSKWGLGERTNHAPTFEAVFREKEPRPGKVTFDLPYDKTFPQHTGDPAQVMANTAPLPIHGLHELVVPAMITDMTPQLSTAERAKITDEVLSNANNLQDLHKRLEEIHQKYSNQT